MTYHKMGRNHNLNHSVISLKPTMTYHKMGRNHNEKEILPFLHRL
jgi:hypothetical protein